MTKDTARGTQTTPTAITNAIRVENLPVLNSAHASLTERRFARWSASYYFAVTAPGRVAASREEAAILSKLRNVHRLRLRIAKRNNRKRGTPTWDREAAARASEPLGDVCENHFFGGCLLFHMPDFLWGELITLTVPYDAEEDLALLRGVLDAPLGVFGRSIGAPEPWQVIERRLEEPLVRRCLDA